MAGILDMGLTAASNLASLQALTQGSMAPKRPGVGVLGGGVGPAQERLTEAKREAMVEESLFKRLVFGGMSPQDFNEQLAVDQAATALEQEQALRQGMFGYREGLQGQTLSPLEGGRAQQRAMNLIEAGGSPADVAAMAQNPQFNPMLAEAPTEAAAAALTQLEQQGIDTRQIPGLMEAMEQDPNQAMLSLAQNQEKLPLNAIGQQKKLEAAQEQAQALGTTQVPFRQTGQAIGLVQDFRTILDKVGTETLPTAEKGAINAIRFRLIDQIRQTTEAGALQAAEIEFFNELIPEGDSWTGLGRQEQYARLNQLEYWWKQKLENQLIGAGQDPAMAQDYMNFGREFDAILGDVPEGTVEDLPEPNAGVSEQRGVKRPPIASPMGPIWLP